MEALRFVFQRRWAKLDSEVVPRERSLAAVSKVRQSERRREVLPEPRYRQRCTEPEAPEQLTRTTRRAQAFRRRRESFKSGSSHERRQEIRARRETHYPRRFEDGEEVEGRAQLPS